jgi:hypothetical protein
MVGPDRRVRSGPMNQMAWFFQFLKLDIGQICKFTATCWMCSMLIFVAGRQFPIPDGFLLTAAATFLFFLIVVFVVRTLFFWIRCVLDGRNFSIAYAKFRHTPST